MVHKRDKRFTDGICNNLKTCIGQSYIGLTVEPTCRELQNYSDRMSQIYLATAIAHMFTAAIVVIVIIISLVRKHHFSCF